MRKVIFGVLLLLILSACGESLPEDVRFMPNEEAVYLYDFRSYKNDDTEEQREDYRYFIDDYYIVSSNRGEIRTIYKETDKGLFEIDPNKVGTKMASELAEDPSILDELEPLPLLKYPVKENSKVTRSDGFVFKVINISETLETPYKTFEDVVRVSVGDVKGAYDFYYFFKEDIGLIAVENSQGISELKEIITKEAVDEEIDYFLEEVKKVIDAE